MTEAESKQKTEPRPEPVDRILTTRHEVTINGETIAYNATCGTLILKEEAEKSGEAAGESEGEKARASIFFTAYTREGVSDPATRPITFAFNGGPGSSSVWLHLGALGPRRVWLGEDGLTPPAPPFHLVENAFSLLDVTDLVFIDPVSTGFSRPVVGEKAKPFHDFKKDIESVGDFIRLYTTRYQRWASPKFLAGESYGTTRSAGLAGYLQARHGMYLNGIMLISAVLNFQTLEFDYGNDLPYIVYLPAYTAAAWYHHRLPADLQGDLHAALREAEEFARGEYTLALLLGDALPAARRRAVVRKLVRLTGLSAQYLEQTDLRIEHVHFCKELRRSENRTIGRLDSRAVGMDRDSIGEYFEYDPSYAVIQGPYTAAFNDYIRRELNFESDLPYEILTERVRPWSYAQHENRYEEVAETLRSAMHQNPALQVHVANGYYDLATPYLATEYTFNHLGLDEALRGNITMSYYEAGHMMYIHQASLEKLKGELAAFIRKAGG